MRRRGVSLPIVYFPTNGVGFGHVALSMRVCEALTALGYRPTIFSDGCYPDYFRTLVPGISLKELAKADPFRLVRRVNSYLCMSSPGILIEDTYPLAIE